MMPSQLMPRRHNTHFLDRSHVCGDFSPQPAASVIADPDQKAPSLGEAVRQPAASNNAGNSLMILSYL